jgi:hypothetical protein
MRPSFLILWLAMTATAQTRVNGCGASAVASASGREVNRETAPRAAIAAKPDLRLNTPLALPQIRYRRVPSGPQHSCWCGTVAFTVLTSPALSQETLMLGGLAGKFRFDHVLLQEEKRFSSDLVDRLTVSVGRPDHEGEMISTFALKSNTAPQNFVFQAPNPPAITGAYDLVLKFAGSSALATDGSSNFSAGSLYWEVCGGQV